MAKKYTFPLTYEKRTELASRYALKCLETVPDSLTKKTILELLEDGLKNLGDSRMVKVVEESFPELMVDESVSYNCAFTIAFSIPGCVNPIGEGIPAHRYRDALEARMEDIESEGASAWQEAVGSPFDFHEE